MENRYHVIISSRAAQMLVSYAMHISQYDRDAADRFIEGFEKASQSLEEFPRRCQWVEGDYIPAKTYRYRIFHKHYMLIFKIEDDNVYVEYVINCRQDYQWLIR